MNEDNRHSAAQRPEVQAVRDRRDNTCAHCSQDMRLGQRCSHDGLCISIADFDDKYAHDSEFAASIDAGRKSAREAGKAAEPFSPYDMACSHCKVCAGRKCGYWESDTWVEISEPHMSRKDAFIRAKTTPVEEEPQPHGTGPLHSSNMFVAPPAAERKNEPNSILPPLSKDSISVFLRAIRPEIVMDVVQDTDYAKHGIDQALHLMSQNERDSLFRAVITLYLNVNPEYERGFNDCRDKAAKTAEHFRDTASCQDLPEEIVLAVSNSSNEISLVIRNLKHSDGK